MYIDATCKCGAGTSGTAAGEMTQKYYDWFGANGQKIFAMTIYFQTEKEWRRVRSYFHFLINIFAIGKFCYKQYIVDIK